MKETLNYLAEEQRRTRRNLKIGLAALLIGGLGVAFKEPLLNALSSERNWRGEHVYEAAGPSRVGEVELRPLHEELLTAWVIERSRGAHDGPAFEALSAAVAPDPTLSGVVAEWSKLSVDPFGNAERLTGLAQAWSRYLEDNEAPWWVEGGVVDLGGGAFFYVKVYEVLVDGAVGIEGEPRRVRLLRRADRLNVRESWLGHVVSPNDGGLMVIDRIVEFAVRDVWPMLDPEGDEALAEAFGAPLSRFGPALRAEAAAALPAEALALLEETAPARRRLVRAWNSAISRRHCSNAIIPEVPWTGFGDVSRAALRELYRSSRGERCPALTLDELSALDDDSEALRETRGLDAAVSALVGWAARATATHEARHVADHGVLEGDVDAEQSAYLASFSTPGVAALSHLQACLANDGAWGAHAQALAATGLGCEASPPELVERARALASERFGASPPTLPPDLAARVPLPPVD